MVVAALAVPPRRGVAVHLLTAADRAASAASLWAEARYNFSYWVRWRADWDSGLIANLKLAAEPQSDLLFYRRLRRLVALLGDGRAAVTAPPPLRSRIARPPLLVSSVERRVFILDYAENDEMRVARPPRLGEILAVQGIPVETWIRDSVLPEVSAATPADRWQRAAAWMLQVDKGTTVHLLVRVPGAEPRGLSVTRSLSLNDRWPLDPPAFATESLPGGVAVVRIASLGDEEVVREFDRAFPDFARVEGLVLDLRRATGRVLISGGRTGGAPGGIASLGLPRSWGVQFCGTRHEAPDGTGFAGVGVRPHLVMIRTVNDLLGGNEPALQKAREYLKSGLPPP